MKGNCPTPICQENFADVWSFTDLQRRSAKKKYVTARVAPFFSNLVFCLLLFFTVIGLIHDHFSGELPDFLGTLPAWLPIWNGCMGLLPNMGLYGTAAAALVVIYVISFVVCCVFVLLVMAVYHPLRQKLPNASVKENAQQLLTRAKQARRYSIGTTVGNSTVSAILFCFGALCVLGASWIAAGRDMVQIAEAVTAPLIALLEPAVKDVDVLFSMQMNMMLPCLTVTWFLLYGVYALLSGLHGLTVQFLMQYPVPYSLVAQIEEYAIFCEAETAAELTLEERQAQAEEKRKKALELEGYGAYNKARELFAEAAHGGDVPAMEHYARHWLVSNIRDPARYWLERAIETGNASDEAPKLLKRIRRRRKIAAKYLPRTT